MKISATPIPGAFLVDIAPMSDERGFFARTVSRDVFAEWGMNADFVQQSVSWNSRKGILRGLHLQAAPHGEEKLVRVTTGAVFDVMVDLRPESPAFRSWFGVELSADNHCSLYIPKGVAHGFQSLTDTAEVYYQMTVPFHPGSSSGVRWDDPAFGVQWPDPAGAILSARDANYPFCGASS